MTELSRNARALGRNMNFFGDKDCDLVLQTKGKIKINFGDKFIDLFNGGKFNVGNKDIITTIEGKPSSKDKDGFYFDKNSGTLYLKVGDDIYEILSNAKSIDGYIVYNDVQNLSKDEKFQAQNNIGISFLTKEDAINSQSEGLVYIASENSVFILKNGFLLPLNGETSNSSNFFKDQVTIDLGNSESLALLIEGLKNYIRVGTESNHTDIYQDQSGGVIDSNNQLTIKIDGKNQITIKKGEISFDSILKALKGIITDEIYSSNFEEGSTGWGLWINKSTGESYLQVDHLLADLELMPTYIRYQEAVEMAVNGNISFGTTYIIIDYQNEWEITSVSDEIGINIITNTTWHPNTDSVDPTQYKDGVTEPKFGVDRNVRPLVIKGKNNFQFEDTASYYYELDNKDIVQMKYDIRTQNYDSEKWPTEEGSTLLDLENKGRIYYVKDIWNNEAPLDFKKYTKDGKHVLNSPENEDLSSLNTNENIVCANNIFWDLNTKNVEELNPIIVTGKKINNNEFRGRFENSTIGSPESEIENNSFSGSFIDTDIIGIFNRNDFRGNIINCKFELNENELRSIKPPEKPPEEGGDNQGGGTEEIPGEGEKPGEGEIPEEKPEIPEEKPEDPEKPVTNLIRVIGNVWNRDIEDCTFCNNIENNTFNSKFTKCIFHEVISNQLMGSMENCNFKKKIENNQISGDLKNCDFYDNTYSNIFNSSIIEGCIWKDKFFGNQISADIWQDNEFRGVLKYNIFQADVIKFICDGMVNNNQFIGRINNVQLLKDSNPDYGINNNIIDGTFIDSVIRVDFSHNTLVGPVELLDVYSGNTGDDNVCLFNFNNITAKSIHNVKINHDFRQNTIKSDYFGELEFNDVFRYNDLQYFNFRIGTLNKMLYCNGEGRIFNGSFNSNFINCDFNLISNCIFRSGSEIKLAVFRSDFSGVNFDTDTNIQNLELLYDSDHQVNIYNHKGKVTISCDICNSPVRGEIKMWSGTVSDIPEGWHICDGTKGTPDLTDKFIKASTVAGQTGGKKEITLESSNIPSHNHTITFDTSGFPDNKFMTAEKIMNFSVNKGEDNNYCLWIGEKSGDNDPGYNLINMSDAFSNVLNSATIKSSSSSITPIKIEPIYYTLIFIMKL